MSLKNKSRSRLRRIVSGLAVTSVVVFGTSMDSMADEGSLRFVDSQLPAETTRASLFAEAGFVRALEYQEEVSPDRAREIEQNRRRGPIAIEPIKAADTRIDDIGTGSRPEDVVVGRLPDVAALPTGSGRDGDWYLQTKPWVPGGFYRQPLYWEEPMLERHGHERFPAMQPVVSGVRFYSTFLMLPYLATMRGPLEDVHTLGSYTPGTAAPMLRYRPHYDDRAIRNQLITSGVAGALLPL